MNTEQNRLTFILITFFLLQACTNVTQQQMSPEEYANYVGDLIVENTDFRFEPALQEFEQDGLYLIDFPVNKTGTYYARSVVEIEGVAEVDYTALLAVSHQAGSIEIEFNGSTIYSNSTKQDGHLKYIDYGLFEYQAKIPMNLSDGVYPLVVRFTPEVAGADRVYFSFIRSDNSLGYEPVSLKSPSDEEELQHYGYWWVGPASSEVDKRELMNTDLSASELIAKKYESTNGETVRWDIPKLHLVKSLPGWLTYQNWHYSGGTFLDAMRNVSDYFEGTDYSSYIKEHQTFLKESIQEIDQMRQDYGLIESPFGHYFRFSLLDDIGMQTVPYVNSLIEAGVDNIDEDSFEYDLAIRVTDHILNDASRMDDDTFARFTPDTMSVWADDLFMSSIVLLKMYELTGEDRYLDEVVNQVIQFDNYLLDEPSNLYWHGYFSWVDENSSSKWSRANGWTIMAKVELLKIMPEDHPRRSEIMDIFIRHCEGLLAVQSDDGRWHQVLDDPTTYLETSGTAMFVRGFAEGVNKGWLERGKYTEAINTGWASLTRQIDEEGNIIGIVRGTPILFSDEEYDNWGTRINDPRGLGALLYAAIAVDEFQIRGN